MPLSSLVPTLSPTLTSLGYLVAAVCFILSLRWLSHPRTAAKGIVVGLGGMVLAIGITLAQSSMGHMPTLLGLIATGLGVGFVVARSTPMTALPQLVAAFHSLVGVAAVGIAGAAFLNPQGFGIATQGVIYTASRLEMSLGLVIGAITFSGSLVAFGKLQGILPGKPLAFRGQHALNALVALALVAGCVFFVMTQSAEAFVALTVLALVLGLTLILPIGGADMPVVVSMLNSYSGWAAAGIGFTLNNHLLIITGALVGASGAILSYIMCKGMNRSLINVLMGGFGSGASTQSNGATGSHSDQPVRVGNFDDAAFILENAKDVIIVPGYGMAVAQAQHALREMAETLAHKGVRVRYAIHPVAGRMPGHMNVLLAEASVPYDDVFELEDINRDFSQTDVAFVIGANDITNPAAKTDPASPIYGMPILDVIKAGTVMFVKRSMAAGYAGVDNSLFFAPNTMMLFGDAKKVCENIVKAMEAS